MIMNKKKIYEGIGAPSNYNNYYALDNKAFKVRLLDVDDDMMQQPAGGDTGFSRVLKIGDVVSGIKLGSEDIEHTGRIVKIKKNSKGEITTVIINDENDKNVSIDLQTIKELDFHGSSGGYTDKNTNAKIVENRAMCYKEWVNEKRF